MYWSITFFDYLNEHLTPIYTLYHIVMHYSFIQTFSKLALPVYVNCALSHIDSFNPVAVVSGNPSQMGIAGQVGAIGPDASSNMGTSLIPDNGVMVMYWCLASPNCTVCAINEFLFIMMVWQIIYTY